MKYKVGDKVRIKTWEQMVKEFGIDSNYPKAINCPFYYTTVMERGVQDVSTDRILTIEGTIYSDSYYMKEVRGQWGRDMIKELVEEIYMILEPIESRFELMEL